MRVVTAFTGKETYRIVIILFEIALSRDIFDKTPFSTAFHKIIFRRKNHSLVSEIRTDLVTGAIPIEMVKR